MINLYLQPRIADRSNSRFCEIDEIEALQAKFEFWGWVTFGKLLNHAGNDLL
jgi:hypothetical protein